MFIRRTPTGSASTGERYFTHRLVSSVRVGGKVRQCTLLNLGRHCPLDQSLWPALCVRIEEILAGQLAWVPVKGQEELEATAQRIAAQWLARKAEAPGPAAGSAGDGVAPPAPDIQSVDVDSLELVRPRSVGVEQLGLWAMRQVDFVPLLTELGLSGPLRAAVLGVILGRMAVPGSEAATRRWLIGESGLGELLETDFATLHPRAFYRASDALMRQRARIESSLFGRVQDLFGFETTITLYDLTNTYFEGEARENRQAQRGHSKQKRSDCPLVTLGLVLDGSGFVRRSETFAGNVAEGSTLQGMLARLDAPQGALVVMDAGIATEANLAWLREQGYRYLVVSRERMRQFDPAQATALQTAAGARVEIQRVADPAGPEVRLYCHSLQREQKENGIAARFCQRFEAGLQRIADGLTKPHGEKRLAKLQQRIGRLQEQSRGVSQHYSVELIPDEQGDKASAIRWDKQPVAGTRLTHPGVSCLRTNQTEWDSERLWRTYVLLTDLEAVFRSLKSELGMRPVYHHKEERVGGHLFITVLAYQFVQIIRKQLQEKGIHHRWSRLREILRVQRRITATFRRRDGGALHIRKATRPEAELLAIYQALGVDPLPGGVEKTYT